MARLVQGPRTPLSGDGGNDRPNKGVLWGAEVGGALVGYLGQLVNVEASGWRKAQQTNKTYQGEDF